MTITYFQARKCRDCGLPLTNSISLRYRVGSECRKDMTGEQLLAALELTAAEKQPGYIWPEKPASAAAQLNNQAARALVADAAAPEVCKAHGGIVGKCPGCRHELSNPAARIIREIQAERRAARDAALATWKASA